MRTKQAGRLKGLIKKKQGCAFVTEPKKVWIVADRRVTIRDVSVIQKPTYELWEKSGVPRAPVCPNS